MVVHRDRLLGTRRKRRVGQFALITLITLVMGALFLQPALLTRAAPNLTIAENTWNVIGLDAADANDGVNIFPVGARVCNTGDTPATNLRSRFDWDSGDSTHPIQLTNQTANVLSIPNLAAGACADFYYHISVARAAASIGATRDYHINAMANGVAEISNPSSTLHVVGLNLQPDIEVGFIEGPTTVYVGQSYDFVVRRGSIPDYGALEHSVYFPNSIFRILEISATYARPPGARNDSMYKDACGWDDESLTCPITGTVGTVGGRLETTYTVEILAPATITLTHMVHGYNTATRMFEYRNGFNGNNLVIQAVDQETPTPTFTATATITPTVSTPTLTGTPPTVTTSPTLTHTPTPTITGTPPTPTRTGTITPEMSIDISVLPNEARVGGSLVFTILVENDGNAPATNVLVSNTLSTLIDFSSATARRVSPTSVALTNPAYNTSTRTVSLLIGTVNPGESYEIRIIVKVSSTATNTTTLTSTAVMTWTPSRTLSDAVVYRVIGTTTLPGTGWMEVEAAGIGFYWPAIMIAVVLAALGILALWYSVWARAQRPLWADWFRGIGLLLTGAAVVFGLAAWGLQVYTDRGTSMAVTLPHTNTPPASPEVIVIGQSPEDNWEMLLPTPLPETLPDYPIPTPAIQTTPGSTEEPLDTTAINRIVIPALDLDTVVKYVPFDGLTWLIAGLKQEVAWMGETSWPGLGSNTALAGHISLQNGGNGPFRYLGDMTYGDLVMLYTEKNIYTYQVREQKTVGETDITVIAPSETSRLTLITCSNWDANARFYMQRLVVTAELVEVKPFMALSSSH